jgi:hypothetical protein
MVVSHLDRYYQGTLLVEILRHRGSSNVARRSGQLVAVRYVSPFYGVTPYLGLNENDGYQNTQSSYGFWAVPPDFGTKVLVIFAESSGAYGYWIGCIQDSNMNFMTPGGPGVSTVLTTETAPENLNGKKLPVGEYNKLIETGEATDPTLFRKPFNKDFTEVLEVQGLLDDEARGTTTSSARRETPSMVFGMSTPGPLDKRVGHPTTPYGAESEEVQIPFNRLGGSSFVMDDGDDKFIRATHAEDGPPIYVNREIGETGGDETIPQNELVRIRTRTGHQILMHNSEDLIYISNSRGTAWLEFTSDGKIDIYANDSISLHTDNDFNLSAERDINMEAGRNVNINASSRWSDYQPVEQGTGSGIVRIEGTNESRVYSNEAIVFETQQSFEIRSTNDILLSSEANIHIKSGSNTYQEATGSIHQRAGHSIYRTSDSNINDRATGLLMQTADGSIHRTSTGANIYDRAGAQHHTRAEAEILRTSGASINDNSGSGIFTTAAASIQTSAGADLIQQAATIQNNSAGVLILQSGGQMSLASGGEIALEASGKLSLASSSVHASANLFVGGNIETPNNLYSNQSIAAAGHVGGRPGAIPSLSGPDSAADAVTALSAGAAITANAATSANTPSGLSPQLRSHTLPKVIPGTGEIISFLTSIPRVPQHEPWPHHENLNPLAFKKHETDLERLGRLPTADKILTPDTFAKGQAGIETSTRIGGSGGNIDTGSPGAYGNDEDITSPRGSTGTGSTGTGRSTGSRRTGVVSNPSGLIEGTEYTSNDLDFDGVAPTSANDRITDLGDGPIPTDISTIQPPPNQNIPPNERRRSNGTTILPPRRLPANMRMDGSPLQDVLPRQNILDSISLAVSKVIPNGSVQIIAGGGLFVRTRGTPNHPQGHAADFEIVINGNKIKSFHHPLLYRRLAEELIANANARGVRPGLGLYDYYKDSSTRRGFLHYDETPSRGQITGLGSAGYWGDGNLTTVLREAVNNVSRNLRTRLDDATVQLTGIDQSGFNFANEPSRNPGGGLGPSTESGSWSPSPGDLQALDFGGSRNAEARQVASDFLGRSLTDQEWDWLVRATIAEASPNQPERGAVMAVILNRVRSSRYPDDVISVLNQTNQFQAVTGTPRDRRPSRNFSNPTQTQVAGTVQAVLDYLPSSNRSWLNFTSNNPRAYGPGTNIDFMYRMRSSPGARVIGQTVFGNV